MEATVAAQPDPVVGGRYTARRRLSGVSGCEVHGGRHLVTGRPVTLKSAGAGDTRSAERLLLEAKALADVSHPALPSVLDALIGPEGQVVVALEHVRGRSLEGLLTARGHLDDHEALQSFRPLSDAVRALHAAGWAGIDVCASAVTLAEGIHPRPVLMDLGSTLRRLRPHDAVTDDVRRLGTLLGALLGPRVTSSERPSGLGHVVARACAARTQDRYPDVDTLLEALAAVGPATPSEPLGRSAQRKHRRAGLVAPARLLLPSAALDVRTEDVSESGVQLLSAIALPVGSEVTLRMALPVTGRITGLRCLVRWVRSRSDEAGPFAVGLEFVDLDARARREVTDYVEALGGFGRWK